MAKILVIEDEPVIRENIVELLQLEGYEVFDAPNGNVGLRLLAEISPNLIICDVHMPGMDGYSVLTIVRSNPVTRSIPFIFLTGRVDRAGIQHGLELGANSYIKKPFLNEIVLDTIREQLGENNDK